MFKTLLIDPDTRDLVIDGNGEFVLIEDDASIAQAIRFTLRVYLGEWFLDDRHGTDYERIMGVHPSDAEIEDIIRVAIFQETEVRHIESLMVSREARSVHIAFRGRLRSGASIDLEVGV